MLSPTFTKKISFFKTAEISTLSKSSIFIFAEFSKFSTRFLEFFLKIIAVFGVNFVSDSMAAAVFFRAECSKNCPSKTSVIITAELSKYTGKFCKSQIVINKENIKATSVPKTTKTSIFADLCLSEANAPIKNLRPQ